MSSSNSEDSEDEDVDMEEPPRFRPWVKSPDFKILSGPEYKLDRDLVLACLIRFDGPHSSSIHDKAEWCLDNEDNTTVVQEILDSVPEEEKATPEVRQLLAPHAEPSRPWDDHLADELSLQRQDASFESKLGMLWSNFLNNNDGRDARDFVTFQDLALHLEVCVFH